MQLYEPSAEQDFMSNSGDNGMQPPEFKMNSPPTCCCSEMHCFHCWVSSHTLSRAPETAMPVCSSVPQSSTLIQPERPQQLLDGLPWNLVQAFKTACHHKMNSNNVYNSSKAVTIFSLQLWDKRQLDISALFKLTEWHFSKQLLICIQKDLCSSCLLYLFSPSEYTSNIHPLSGIFLLDASSAIQWGGGVKWVFCSFSCYK